MEKSPLSRHERYEILCAQVDHLVARYSALPPGRAQSLCQADIDAALRAIDDLNHEEPPAPPKPARSVDNLSPAKISLGVLTMSIGSIAQIAFIVVCGLILTVVGSGIFHRSPAVPAQADVAPPPEGGFRWRP